MNLKEDFSKKDWTYGSSHLAGVRQGVKLTYNGLTIDASLEEERNSQGNNLYFWSDITSNTGYGTLRRFNINDRTMVVSTTGTSGEGTVDYCGANQSKSVYVILDPDADPSALDPENDDLETLAPEFNKTLVYNEDGTYTLSLDIKVPPANAGALPNANVLFIVDTSSSMTKETSGGSNRLRDTQEVMRDMAQQLLSFNTEQNPTAVELAMVSFDGGVVNEIGWGTSLTAFNQKVNGLTVHTGTDWEDGLKLGYEIAKAKRRLEPKESTYVIFMTDGEPSQYTNFNGPGDPSNGTIGYRHWYS